LSSQEELQEQTSSSFPTIKIVPGANIRPQLSIETDSSTSYSPTVALLHSAPVTYLHCTSLHQHIAQQYLPAYALDDPAPAHPARFASDDSTVLFLFCCRIAPKQLQLKVRLPSPRPPSPSLVQYFAAYKGNILLASQPRFSSTLVRSSAAIRFRDDTS
jgi:hypothetical protein